LKREHLNRAREIAEHLSNGDLNAKEGYQEIIFLLDEVEKVALSEAKKDKRKKT
jgi:hypothetical protein